ncbi:PIPO, partial [Yambean mosaic virus]|uniref:PIPO n=1 Tax=Yambean mosaic virus TaxID=418827 RepID=UPI000265503D
NVYKSFATGVARLKLVGKIFLNMAIEAVSDQYRKRFDSEGFARKKRVIKKLCERLLHKCEVTPKKQKRYYLQVNGEIFPQCD